MRWSELTQRQPQLAELGRQRLLAPGVVLAATIRSDGTPRLSPVEPLVLDGTLWLSMMWQSRKAADLARDPRILVHSVVTSRDGGEGEFKVGDDVLVAQGFDHSAPVQDSELGRFYAHENQFALL